MRFYIGLAIALFAGILIAVAQERRPGIREPYSPPPPALSATPSYTTSWFGNSFSGKTKLMQRTIYGLYVSPDGTCYTNSLWDESGQEAAIYRDGDVMGVLPGLNQRNPLTSATRAVTGDSKYIFYSAIRRSGPNKSQATWYVGRSTPDGRAADWPGLPDNFLPVTSVTWGLIGEGAVGEIWGMAVDGGDLYVATEAPDRVWVFDENSGKLKRSFDVTHPGAMAIDRTGCLWIVQRPDTPGHTVETTDSGLGFQILQYTPTGVPTGKSIPYVGRPQGIAFDNRGRLMVADDGPAQQILIYDVAGQPKLVDSFGIKGGLLSGAPGEEAPLKLPYPVGVGVDSKGDIYVASRYPVTGCELRAFTPDGALKWRLYSDEFMNCSDADPASDGTLVYSPRECFRIDFSKPPGQQATLVANTVDKFRYPDDPRLHGEGAMGYAPLLRRLNGRLYMYLIGERGRIAIFKQTSPGYIFAPCGFFSEYPIPNGWPPGQPLSGRWLWSDKNGDGRIDPNEISSDGVQGPVGWNLWVDTHGTIWYVANDTHIVSLPVLGFDRFDNPIYSLSAAEDQGVPSAFAQTAGNIARHILRIEYDAADDKMYLGGYADGPFATLNTRGSVFERSLGPELFCYQHWSRPDRSLLWRIPLVYSSSDQTAGCTSFTTTPDDVFVGATGGGGNQNKIWVYSAATGKILGLITPGVQTGEIGWIDFTQGLRAYQRKDGETLLFVEDVWKEKQEMYILPSKVFNDDQ